MLRSNSWTHFGIEGSWRRKSPTYPDQRGYFIVSYQDQDLPVKDIRFVQDNLSYSKINVLRGLHTQQGQWQMVTVALGEILYVTIDLDAKSTTFGKHALSPLNANSENQLVARPGIAHGFLVLSEIAVLNYK